MKGPRRWVWLQLEGQSVADTRRCTPLSQPGSPCAAGDTGLAQCKAPSAGACILGHGELPSAAVLVLGGDIVCAFPHCAQQGKGLAEISQGARDNGHKRSVPCFFNGKALNVLMPFRPFHTIEGRVCLGAIYGNCNVPSELVCTLAVCIVHAVLYTENILFTRKSWLSFRGPCCWK